MKKVSKIALITLVGLPLAWAQHSRAYQEGRDWAEETTGSLENARNLNVNVDAGAVRVEGGSYPDIRYVFNARAHLPSEEAARREFASCKTHAHVQGDAAYLAAQCFGKQSLKLSGEFVIRVPREIQVETGYGAIVARLISGKSRPDSSLETSGGDVTVYLVPNLNVTVRASIELADGHTVRSDFREIQIRTEGEVGGKNGGGPLLKIQTTTGDIRIARSQ